jgi:carboxymethylenebutenolidase
MPVAKHLQHQINSGYVQIVADQRNIPAFWAHPRHGGPFPALVLLHDDHGLSAHMRLVVNRFAEVGYYVIAPDLLEGQLPQSREAAALMEHLHRSAAAQKAQAALKALQSHHKSNNKLAIVGWDFGATLAFELALSTSDLMAAVAFYGNPQPFQGKWETAHCPIMALFGQHDDITRAYENQLREELIRSSRPHEVVVYPDTKHYFFNDNLPDFYQAESAEDAWRQTLAFLETHQGKPPAPHGVGNFQPGGIF